MEIPESLRPLFDIVGTEKAMEVIRAYQGSNVYFSKNVLRAFNHERLIEEYHAGSSYRELADKYGYSESHVRRVCNKS